MTKLLVYALKTLLARLDLIIFGLFNTVFLALFLLFFELVDIGLSLLGPSK